MHITHKITLFILIFIFNIKGVSAQSWFDDGLSPAFHKERREALRQLMPNNSVAVFFNNPVKIRSNDTEYDYRPNSDFYYLTGFREPNSALLVFQSAQNWEGIQTDEIMYVQPRDPSREQWDGERLGIDGVKDKLGFQYVFLNDQFLIKPAIDLTKFNQVFSFDLTHIEGGRHNAPLLAMIGSLKLINPSPARPADLALNQMMDILRVKKTVEELALLRKAINISGKAHIEAIKSIQPGVSEREIQGVHEFVHKANGAENVGYASIIGAGNNSTILHYVYNSVRDLKDGVVLMDVGAEFRGYTGDITRTVPVKGVFSPEEKAIYQIVLNALDNGIKACKPGSSFQEIDRASRKTIDQGLADLGIIKPGERHPYFPHGIGHHLGLDVHDRGNYGLLEPGMVITVEPGIYIPEGSDCDPKWWKIGIRIEDNILIKESGYENLSQSVPKTISEIEKLMKDTGILQKL